MHLYAKQERKNKCHVAKKNKTKLRTGCLFILIEKWGWIRQTHHRHPLIHTILCVLAFSILDWDLDGSNNDIATNSLQTLRYLLAVLSYFFGRKGKIQNKLHLLITTSYWWGELDNVSSTLCIKCVIELISRVALNMYWWTSWGKGGAYGGATNVLQKPFKVVVSALYWCLSTVSSQLFSSTL